MEALMQLQIITPDRLMCDESVKMVEMRTAASFRDIFR